MKTLFKSQELSDLVENGYADQDDEARLRENRKKDSNALFFIQQAVHDTIFSRIAAAETSKDTWGILQKEFQGSIKDEIVVVKVLRSLTTKLDHVVATIEESKDVCIFLFDELMDSLQAHEARMNSGCSNHMWGVKSAFKDIDESEKKLVRLDDNKPVQVEAEFKDSMMRKFEMSNLGMLHYFLGLEIKQLEDGVFMSQRKYAIDLLKRFNMLNCKVAATPMNLNEKLQS
ncbi:hypothetical protein RJ640_002760 [Escallonia rubra]|uniref:Mitochondrial protein n=1 Tax=Escallonia rubra TaxID=112253 RepID=A0AA88RZL8_9ASTE|nr:hypothetical protein RJ640_002760 [Escallonia rubra]